MFNDIEKSGWRDSGIVSPCGSRMWIDPDFNSQKWIKNNQPHMSDRDENGLVLPAIITGLSTYWYINGQQHRDDKDENGLTLPAVIHPVHDLWFENGVRHRTEVDSEGFPQPSAIYFDPDFAKDSRWYIHGVKSSVEEICKYMNVSEEIKILMLLKYN